MCGAGGREGEAVAELSLLCRGFKGITLILSSLICPPYVQAPNNQIPTSWILNSESYKDFLLINNIILLRLVTWKLV